MLLSASVCLGGLGWLAAVLGWCQIILCIGATCASKCLIGSPCWAGLVPLPGITWYSGKVQCSAVQCSTVQCSAVQCSAVQCPFRIICEAPAATAISLRTNNDWRLVISIWHWTHRHRRSITGIGSDKAANQSTPVSCRPTVSHDGRVTRKLLFIFGSGTFHTVGQHGFLYPICPRVLRCSSALAEDAFPGVAVRLQNPIRCGTRDQRLALPSPCGPSSTALALSISSAGLP